MWCRRSRGIGATPEAGTYTLTEEDINNQIQTGNADLSDLRFVITPAGLELRFGEQGQDVAYSAQVSAVDGQIQVEGAELDGVPTWIIPTGAISNGLERGINELPGSEQSDRVQCHDAGRKHDARAGGWRSGGGDAPGGIGHRHPDSLRYVKRRSLEGPAFADRVNPGRC